MTMSVHGEARLGHLSVQHIFECLDLFDVEMFRRHDTVPSRGSRKDIREMQNDVRKEVEHLFGFILLSGWKRKREMGRTLCVRQGIGLTKNIVYLGVGYKDVWRRVEQGAPQLWDVCMEQETWEMFARGTRTARMWRTYRRTDRRCLAASDFERHLEAPLFDVFR